MTLDIYADLFDDDLDGVADPLTCSIVVELRGIEPLTYSMRTSGLGRWPPMTALGSEETRSPSRWARWRVEAVAEATTDGLRTARSLSPRQWWVGLFAG